MTRPNWDIPVGKQMAGTLDTEYLLMILDLEGDKFSIRLLPVGKIKGSYNYRTSQF
jgi:hypothetical protein